MTKIDIMSPDRLQKRAKNKKTRWKMFVQRKNTAQKNAREISGSDHIRKKDFDKQDRQIITVNYIANYSDDLQPIFQVLDALIAGPDSGQSVDSR